RTGDRIDGLSQQIEQLRSRVESIRKPAPAPDLGPLEKKVARVVELSQRVEAMEKRLEPLSGEPTRSDRRLAELDSKLDGRRKGVGVLHDRMEASPKREGSPTAGPDRSGRAGSEASSPAQGSGGPVDSALGRGMSLFREGRYQPASDAFKALAEAHPED